MDFAHRKGQLPVPRSVMMKHPRIMWKGGESSKPSDAVGKVQCSNDEAASSSSDGGDSTELMQLSERLAKEVSTGQVALRDMSRGAVAKPGNIANCPRELKCCTLDKCPVLMTVDTNDESMLRWALSLLHDC